VELAQTFLTHRQLKQHTNNKPKKSKKS
jgi:hypothetical protein